MSDLKIDAELREWIAPLSTDEYMHLESSILAEGCRDPLVAWSGYLLDGHNRYEICQKHGLQFSTVEKTGLKTKDDVKIWMLENQLSRRNVTDFARVEIMLKLKPMLDARAKERQLSGLKVGDSPVEPNSAQQENKRTVEEIAHKSGVGKSTVQAVEKIIQKATPEVINQARTGVISINAAANTFGAGKMPKQKNESNPAPSNQMSPELNAGEFSPSDEEIAQSIKDEQVQLDYIKDLLANEDDPLTKALSEIKMLRNQVRVSTLIADGLNSEKTLLIRTVKSLQAKLRKLEAAV